MKKTIAIMLALCLLVSFAACGSSPKAASKSIVGTWNLYDEGASSPKGTFVFNEDMTGEKISVSEGREETVSFTYTVDEAGLHIAYENGTTSDLTFTVDGDTLTVAAGNKSIVYSRAS